MRLDYTLYGLAIIFFIVAAVSLIVVSDQTGKMLLTVSTTVIGLVSVSTGFMLKPKVQTAASTSAPAVTQEVQVEQTVQATTLETPVVEAPKTVAAPVVDAPAVVVAPPAEAPPVAVPVFSEAAVEAPVAVPAPIAPAKVSSPTSEVSTEAPVTTAVPIIGLTQVKGIGEKRATQLKDNGINSIEDLAKADVVDLAAKLRVSPKLVEKWVAGAKDLIK